MDVHAGISNAVPIFRMEQDPGWRPVYFIVLGLLMGILGRLGNYSLQTSIVRECSLLVVKILHGLRCSARHSMQEFGQVKHGS
jgi:hypothetical protein